VQAGTHPKHLSSRRLTTPSPRLGRVPRGYPATWLVAGAAAAGVVAAVDIGGLQICRQRASVSLSKAIYVSEQVCIRWRRTGAYYTAKLTFSHDFPVKVCGAYCTSVRIIYSNFYGMRRGQIFPNYLKSLTPIYLFTVQLLWHYD